MSFKLYTDGGARGNPGQAAIGIVLTRDNEIIFEYKERIGQATNNEAEYRALKKGLDVSLNYSNEVECFLDSKLVVSHLNGEYKLKAKNLFILFDQIKELIRLLKKISFKHVPRENKFIQRADDLVNEALDS